MKAISIVLAVTGIVCGAIVFAQTNPPSPETIGTQLNNYWMANQLDQAEAYITDLSTNYPNYVPVILAKACYEGVYHSNISNVVAGVDRVRQANIGTDYFKALLSAEKTQMQLLLQFYYAQGTSHADLTNAASAQGVRSAVPEWPYLELITNAPNASVSSP